jgi:hypothetical protein
VKILLDENLPHALRGRLLGHDVFTVSYMGWAGTKNGALLQVAAGAAFDVMVTMDSGVSYQQNRQSLPIAVMILSAPSNDIDDIIPLIPTILERLNRLAPCSIARIP